MIGVMIPVLNEADAITDVIDAIPESVCGHETEIYVIDGGSDDGTVDTAAETRATIVKQQYRGGKGGAVRQGLDAIDADIVVMLDGDGTYDPPEMEKLVQPIIDDEADHVIGKRSDREHGSIPVMNRFGNWLFNKMVRWFYGMSVTDMLSGYRALDSDLCDRLALTSNGFGVETEMTIRTMMLDARLTDVRIMYQRRVGSSELRPVRDGGVILGTIMSMARDTRPMRFFSMIAGIFFISGLYPALLVIQERLKTGSIEYTAPAVLASLLFLAALHVFLFGMLADQQKNTFERLEKRLDVRSEQ